MGFIDAEASFSVSVKIQRDTAYGVRIDPVFSIAQQERKPLELIRNIISAGRIIRKPGQEHLWLLIIDSISELSNRLIPFLDKNRELLLVKEKSYKIFRRIVTVLSRREHRKVERLKELVELAYELSKLNPKAKRRKNLDQVLKLINSRVAERGELPGER